MGRKLLIVLIVVAVGVGGYFIYRSASGSSTSSSGNVQITDKGMKITSGAKSMDVQYIGDPAKVNYGIGIYPGATVDSSKESSATAKINDVTITYGTFVTTSGVDAVLAFYQKQMGSQALTNSISDGETSYKVLTIKGKQTPVISIYTESGQTKFRILK